MIKIIIDLFKDYFKKTVAVYYSLNLRLKFTILLNSILLIVILLISFAMLESEKRDLRQKVDEICIVSVQNLSSVARDNLLTRNYVSIQDVINNMMKLKLEGFEYAFVMDRDGRMVAHSDPLKITEIDSSYLNYLHSDTNFTVNSFRRGAEYLQILSHRMQDPNGNLRTVVIGVAGVAFSHAMIDQALNQAKQMIFLIALIVLLISIFVVHFISKRMSKNIIALAKGVGEIAKGNLDVEIRVQTRDEIGLLAREFNRMVRSLRENVQMQKFVSRLTVDMIQSQSGGTETVQSFQKKEITVLFTDIRGFTKLSEKLAPEQLVEIVNIYLKLQSKFIEDHGGVIDKFAGDAVMAIFQNENSSDNAIKAAVAIQKKIKELNKIRRKNNQEYLTIGIGINYGEAMIGSMGASSRMDYTAIGDVVNLASKLCSFSRAGHIVITKNVIRYLSGAFSVIKMEPVLLSGRRKPVQVYRIVYD
ncbi:MAG TPA: HAMP domain-containing protein [Bacteroidetes bacterium]|nr:HAMP domain-containing protein [Bacteroidota bacterium]